MSTPSAQPPVHLSPQEAEAWGGFTRAASLLTSLLGEPVSRQRVYSWWRWRERNGFPAKQVVRLHDGRTKEWFKLEDVRSWGTAHREEKERERGFSGTG